LEEIYHFLGNSVTEIFHSVLREIGSGYNARYAGWRMNPGCNGFDCKTSIQQLVGDGVPPHSITDIDIDVIDVLIT
jgi:hypothetical protein